MPIEITMPRLSDTMAEGTLIKWRVQVGDKVANGDILADIETDKATMELQSYDDGTIAQLAVDEGQTAPVGRLILLLAQEDESIEEAIEAVGQTAAATPSQGVSTQIDSLSIGSSTADIGQPKAQQPPGIRSEESSSGSSTGLRVSPLARKIAEEHGLDLNSVRGTGPDGRIIKRDVLSALGQAPAKEIPTAGTASIATTAKSPATVQTTTENPTENPNISSTSTSGTPVAEGLVAQTITISNMRRTIARRLVESKTTIPHFTVTVTVDMDALLQLRSTLNEQLAASAGDGQIAVKLSVNDFIVRASALALVRHPQVNSSWSDEGIIQHGTVNVGVAVALPQQRGGGLVVPTIRHAHLMGLRQISVETRTLASKARGQGLTLDEMSDGTFTVSNLGMYGVDHFEAIINPPQAAILAVGAATKQPTVRNGQVTVGQVMSATLSADHRVVDGAMAGQWLATLRQLLENPAVLLV